MNKLTKFVATLCLATLLAAPSAYAQDMDVTAITCSEYTSMDEAGQLAAATALIERLASRQAPDSARIRLNEVCDGQEAATRLIVAATAGMTMDQ